MNTQTQQIGVPSTSNDESILVVKRDHLFSLDYPAWQGIERKRTDLYVELIASHQEYQPRSIMELDQNYKQIIPYMIFKYADHYFMMQRTATTSEQRLKNKYSLGIGGHVRQQDVVGNDLMVWAQREFHEEILYHGSMKVTPLGVLNDDSNEVGKVHLGLVLLLEGNSADIAVKSELKSGQLLTLSECQAYYDHLESWSKYVVDMLVQEEKRA